MERIVYVDPDELQYLDARWPEEADPKLTNAVRDAIAALPESLNLVVFQRFYEGLTIPQIANSMGLTVREAESAMREARRLLRRSLAEFVKRRWGIDSGKPCAICSHPSRPVIDRMLMAKAKREAWGAFSARLEKVIGDRIHPPNILITHCKHIIEWPLSEEKSNEKR